MQLKKREIPRGENGGLFLKFKDGQSTVGVFRGEVYEFFIRWVGGKSEIVEPDVPGAKSRFRMNFVTQEEGKFVAKIFECGLTVYNQLAEIAEEYDLVQTKIKLTRRGMGTDTVYMTLPLLKEPIPAKVMKEIEAIPLNMLEHKDKPQAQRQSEPDDGEDDSVPF